MAVARITEIKASSSVSFDDAIREGLTRACKTLEHVKSAWIDEQEVTLAENGDIASYRVLMKITFLLND
jgi:dodecin